jgi:hypothetical protein
MQGGKQSHGGETVVMMEGMKRLDRRHMLYLKIPCLSYLVTCFGLGCAAVLMRDLALDATDGYLPGSTESLKRCVVQARYIVRHASTSETPPS